MDDIELKEELIIEDVDRPKKNNNLKIKRLSVKVNIKEFYAMEKHYRRRGFKSMNEYLYFLIRSDLDKHVVKIK